MVVDGFIQRKISTRKPWDFTIKDRGVRCQFSNTEQYWSLDTQILNIGNVTWINSGLHLVLPPSLALLIS